MKNLDKDEYLYGKCHLFAYVLAKINNWKVECVYDTEAYDEDYNIIPVNCLVHAYVVDEKGRKYDINGEFENVEEYILNNYECNSMYIERYDVKEFNKKIKSENWIIFKKNEINKIINLIVNYELPLIPKDKKYLKKIIKEEIKVNKNKCNLNHIDVSNITDMSELFSNSNFNGDISKWDVSKVNNMNLMFYNSKFNGDISNWNVKNLNISYGMFAKSQFNQNITKWDVSNVKNLISMFLDCPAPKPWWYITNDDLRREVIAKNKLQNELGNTINYKSSKPHRKI